MKPVLYHTTFKYLVSMLMAFSTILLSAQTLTVVTPNGGETWLTETTQTVSWSNTGDPVDIMIEYSTDESGYWYYLGYVSTYDSANSFTFYNYMPATTTAKIRVSDYNDPDNFDESDGFFTVKESPVYFYTPYYYDMYYRTSVLTLEWYSYTLSEFNLAYSTDNGSTWTEIVNNHTGFDYDWTVPDLLSDSCFIRITDPADSTNYGISSRFSIVELPSVTINTPNGGETWNYGQTYEVTWTGTNLPYYMYLEISTDGGNNWEYLGYAYGSDTSGMSIAYVPYTSTDSAYVRISDPAAPGLVFDINDGPFSIYVPPVIVYYPSEGQEFYNESQAWVSWLAQENIDSLKIELSTDNGQTWSLVEESIDADAWGYDWTVSGTPSQACILRLSDVNDTSSHGISGVFTILETPVITLTSPSGGEILNTSSNYPITWEYDNPNAYYIYLEYSTDGGQNWNHVGYVPHEGVQGSYDWETPSIESEQCLIRVSDYSLYFVYDTSDLFSVLSFPETPICMVSVDSATNQNIVVWEKPISSLIDQFIIYREGIQANVYEPVGMVEYNEPAVFIDTNSNPVIKSYRYKLGFTDSDGHVFPMSDFHQSIHLSINQGVGNSWNLLWTSYLGFEVSTYTIYRSDDENNYEQIASVSGSFNSYSDFTATEGNVYYIVQVVNPNGCIPTSRNDDYSVSRSNVANNLSQGIDEDSREISASIFPNPATEFVNLTVRNDLDGTIRIELTDLLGRIVHHEVINNLRKGEQLRINTEKFKNGMYILTLRSSQAYFSEGLIVK